MNPVSQKTLGLIRDALNDLGPEEVFSYIELQTHWKDLLFDGGLPPAFIDAAATYSFRWGDIFSDLYTGRFGNKNQNFAASIPPAAQEDYLVKLIKFAAARAENTLLGHKIRESLRADLDLAQRGLEKKAPSEIAKLPKKNALTADLSSKQFTLPVSLLFIDLDHFKSVNDQLGHSVGDRCLDSAVKAMASAVEGKGKLYRLGGDEFCILLPNFSADEAGATAERVRSAIQAVPPIGDRINVTASIGTTTAVGAFDPSVLIEQADDAMYISKFTTKNRVTAWPGGESDRIIAEQNRAKALAKVGAQNLNLTKQS